MKENSNQPKKKCRNYENFELMKQVAFAIMQGKTTSRGIYESIRYKGTNENFRSALSMLKQKGYIRFNDSIPLPIHSGNKKHHYAITKKCETVLNRKPRRCYNQEHVPLLNAVHSGGTSTTNEPINDKIGSSTSDDYFEKYIDASNEITKLKSIIKEYEKQDRIRRGTETRQQTVKIKKQSQYMQNAQSRINISTLYHKNSRYLDSEFFRVWKPYIPVIVGGTGALDIISSMNAELRDEKRKYHASLIPFDQIIQYQMYIKSVNQKSITICSHLDKSMKKSLPF